MTLSKLITIHIKTQKLQLQANADVWEWDSIKICLHDNRVFLTIVSKQSLRKRGSQYASDLKQSEMSKLHSDIH